MKWLKSLKGKIKLNEPLSRHTSFKIGGSSLIWFEPRNVDDLINCLQLAKRNKMPYFLIGNGTNILIRNGKLKSLVIKLNNPLFKRVCLNGNILTVGSGVAMSKMIDYLKKRNISGYEFLVGIPGTVGGALVMNAGITSNGNRYDISDIIYRVKAINKKGKVINLKRTDIKFGYRESSLKKYIILEAQFKLNKSSSLKAKNRIEQFLLLRKGQDYSRPNVGCIFRNPSRGVSAAYLIDRCGCKGMRYGGAMVSNRHANFILNFNGATANDVIKLINRIKRRVKSKFNIRLKEEINIV